MSVGKIFATVAFGSTLLVSGAALADKGPFTQKQAEAGHANFNTLCAQCHRPNLQGAQGPSLVDDAFKKRWGDKKVSDLRDFIYENMPANAPKSVKPDQLDPIVAWILSKNGIEPGDKDLTKESASVPFPKK